MVQSECPILTETKYVTYGTCLCNALCTMNAYERVTYICNECQSKDMLQTLPKYVMSSTHRVSEIDRR